MKKAIVFLLLFCKLIFPQNAWINEFHYDNTGTPDIGEFVEVAVEDAGSYDIADFRISFYSSSSGTRYGVYHDLSTFDIGITDNNITLYTKMIPGIQNGPNDGLALDYDGNVLQFISYEGILTASEGVAEGLTSVDVGVEEDNSTPAGHSIGLIGSGTNPSDFTWTSLSDDTPGDVNENQALPVELTTFTGFIRKNEIYLEWETATEINNYGFEIEKKFDSSDWSKIGFVEGAGNSNSPKRYSFCERFPSISGKYFFRLKQIDIDGNSEYSEIIEIESNLPASYNLFQNYPNPFNPETTIQFELPVDSHVELSVYNVLGEKISAILHGFIKAGTHSVQFNADNLTSGIYFYGLKTGSYSEFRKMILAK